MKFLFASDSFKGSLSSRKSGELLSQAAAEVFEGCTAQAIPMADGGEGTMEAMVSALSGTIRTVLVRGPLGDPVEARYGILPGNTAIVEMAEASGLCLVPEEKRSPWEAGSWGTGELLADALDQGMKSIILAIGGSATNDGGLGALSALGIRFKDLDGNLLCGRGCDLERVAQVDCSGLHPAAAGASFTVMCDVDNPLLGPDGATMTFGPQKGADPAMLEKLERGMENFASRSHRDLAAFPGAGAAGGMGFAMKAFLGADLKSGVETVLDLLEFDRLLEDVDLVVTGEGRLDWQSARGKVVSGVAGRCRKKSVPVLALVGGLGPGAERIYECGVSGLFALPDGPASLSDLMERAPELYLNAARRMFRILRTGCDLAKKG